MTLGEVLPTPIALSPDICIAVQMPSPLNPYSDHHEKRGHTDTDSRQSREEGGRDGSDAATSQEMPTRSHQECGGRGREEKEFSPESLNEGGTTNPQISDF